jgi:hypothetical protein
MKLNYRRSSPVVNPADAVTAKATWPHAAIFDFDGTLADTTSRWTTAYECCLRKRGRVADEPTLLALAGASVPDAARTLAVPPVELAVALTEAFREQPLTEMPGLGPRTRSYMHDRCGSGFCHDPLFVWVVGERYAQPTVDLGLIRWVGLKK